MTPPHPPPPPPDHRYKIKGTPILGRHSVVLLAKNIYSRARVAIKFYTHQEHFDRELAALKQLSSMYVPALEEPITGLDFPPALVMERGKQTLTDWLRSQRPDAMLQKTALHQILGALVHLHSHKLVHRDLKPSNIMWFEESHRYVAAAHVQLCMGFGLTGGWVLWSWLGKRLAHRPYDKASEW